MLIFVANGLTALRGKLGNFEPSAPTIYEVPISVVEQAPPAVKRLGCAPSFSVYGEGATPESLGDQQRTTGCHLHISDPHLTQELLLDVVRWADVLVGATWTYISPEDSAVEKYRRTAYGRAGEHRRNIYPPYYDFPRPLHGVEYRSLPGRVLTHPAYLTLMLRLYRAAMFQATHHGPPTAEFSDMARHAINESDKDLAGRLVARTDWTPRSRSMIEFYREPLPMLSVETWCGLGLASRGCLTHFYVNQK
jgi:hypothetical protein